MAASTTGNGPCHFFRLSAELRNRIYDEVLVEEDFIPIDTRGRPDIDDTDAFAQPGLLQTCRKIRSEASSIYYGENRFLFEIADLDAGKLIAFCKHAGGYWKSYDCLYVYICKSVSSWRNMTAWLRAFHAGEAPACDCGSEASSDKRKCLPFKMFQLIDELDPKREMEWPKMAMILQLTQEMVGAGDGWIWTC